MIPRTFKTEDEDTGIVLFDMSKACGGDFADVMSDEVDVREWFQELTEEQCARFIKESNKTKEEESTRCSAINKLCLATSEYAANKIGSKYRYKSNNDYAHKSTDGVLTFENNTQLRIDLIIAIKKAIKETLKCAGFNSTYYYLFAAQYDCFNEGFVLIESDRMQPINKSISSIVHSALCIAASAFFEEVIEKKIKDADIYHQLVENAQIEIDLFGLCIAIRGYCNNKKHKFEKFLNIEPKELRSCMSQYANYKDFAKKELTDEDCSYEELEKIANERGYLIMKNEGRDTIWVYESCSSYNY